MMMNKVKIMFFSKRTSLGPRIGVLQRLERAALCGRALKHRSCIRNLQLFRCSGRSFAFEGKKRATILFCLRLLPSDLGFCVCARVCVCVPGLVSSHPFGTCLPRSSLIACMVCVDCVASGHAAIFKSSTWGEGGGVFPVHQHAFLSLRKPKKKESTKNCCWFFFWRRDFLGEASVPISVVR